MKLLRRAKPGFVFHFGQNERQLLLDTLRLYPLVPASHHKLTKRAQGESAEENQRLLEEALAEQRRENQREVLSLLNEPDRFRAVKSGYELALSPGQMEWLLQVLNDIRVGSWLMLGEPEQGDAPNLNPENARYLLTLELCGLFESVLLRALGIGESPEWLGD